MVKKNQGNMIIPININPKNNNEMKNKLITLILLCVSVCGLHSQNKTIKGRVISEDLETLAGVSIMIKDSVEVGRTDIKGFFLIEIPISEKKITFGLLGLEPTTIELKKECDETEVVMMYLYTYDFISLKRAERKRKKRFKKLNEIHKRAFDKRIFKTEYICYNRNFEYLYH